jgi:D-alanyl-lipoteichoic acid acyltransferase DltB (MBOAT superfamily)
MRPNRQYVAIFATMMTIALWHNNSIPLVIFGIYHSCGLIGARLMNLRRPAATNPSWRLSASKATLLFVFVAVSMPMLTLSLGQLGGFYKALLGFG